MFLSFMHSGSVLGLWTGNHPGCFSGKLTVEKGTSTRVSSGGRYPGRGAVGRSREVAGRPKGLLRIKIIKVTKGAPVVK